MTQVAPVQYDPLKELEDLRAENERLTRSNKVMKTLIDRRKLDSEQISDEQILWIITMRFQAYRDQVADLTGRCDVLTRGHGTSMQIAKDLLRKEMSELRKEITELKAGTQDAHTIAATGNADTQPAVASEREG